MRKSILFTLTALTATAIMGTPFVSRAESSNDLCRKWQQNGCIITGSRDELEEIREQLAEAGVIFGGIGFGNCQIIGIPGIGLPKPEMPEVPDTPEVPDIPEVPETPETEAPETEAPVLPTWPEETPIVPEETPDEGADPILSYTEQVVKLVNEERAKAGLPALTIDRSVEAAAQVRAKEIEVSFSHTRPNGSSFSTALVEQGVDYRVAGENIAWGQLSPEAVMQGWMNSEGHRANILSPKYTKIGVGYYQNAAGRNFWTQLFI